MKNKNVVVFWDWNGTIVDDAFVFVDILNVLLKKNKKPQISLDFYKNNFCFPVADIYKKIGLYKNSFFFNSLNKSFINLYNKNKHLPKLKPNIKNLVLFLRQNNIKQYIVSAHNNKTLHSLVAFYGLNNLFVDVVGVDNDLALGKTSLAVALKKQQCKNADIFVVGDTLLDFEVASSIGAKCVFVDWGHYSFLRLSDCKVPVFSSVGALKSFFIQEMELASL